MEKKKKKNYKVETKFAKPRKHARKRFWKYGFSQFMVLDLNGFCLWCMRYYCFLIIGKDVLRFIIKNHVFLFPTFYFYFPNLWNPRLNHVVLNFHGMLFVYICILICNGKYITSKYHQYPFFKCYNIITLIVFFIRYHDISRMQSHCCGKWSSRKNINVCFLIIYIVITEV